MPPIVKQHVCDIPGCTWGLGGGPASYDMPQHLGLHKFHKHGIKGTARSSKDAARKAAIKDIVASQPKRPPKQHHPQPKPLPPLRADDICRLVLEQVAPNGAIPIAAIPSYNEWVAQTEAFLVYLLG